MLVKAFVQPKTKFSGHEPLDHAYMYFFYTYSIKFRLSCSYLHAQIQAKSKWKVIPSMEPTML